MPRAPRIRRCLLVVGLLAGMLVTPAVSAGAVPISRSYTSAIDAYARYDGQRGCSATEQPGVAAFRALLRETYGANPDGILRSCSRAGKSEHKEGRAYDWMLDADDPEDRAKAEEVLEWLLATDEHGNRHAMARRFGVMYIIWNRRTWSAYRPEEGWQPYRGASPHTDHIHFSFSWEGAERETSFWTTPVAEEIDTEEIVTAAPGPFPDVTQAAPFVAAIDWAVEERIASGRPDGRFRPHRPVTRAQMATFLWRAAGEPAAEAGDRFEDVPDEAYYQEAVRWLAGEGITDGVGEERFAPAAHMTRGQTATMLYRLQGAPATHLGHGFHDVTAEHHYDDAVAWLTANDVVHGVTPARFAGDQPVTRAQAAALLHRLHA